MPQAAAQRGIAVERGQFTEQLAGGGEQDSMTVDHRLMHNAEVVSIEGDSYRAKEARERAERKVKQRRGGKS